MTSNEEVDILLVEDNPAHVEIAMRAFRKHNLANRVTVAEDGEEALDYLFGRGAHEGREAGRRPRLVILDLKLPKVDGLEVLKELRADERTRLTPVVILTTSSEERDIVESYQLGVNSFVVKPMSFEAFTKAVADLGLYWAVLNRPPP